QAWPRCRAQWSAHSGRMRQCAYPWAGDTTARPRWLSVGVKLSAALAAPISQAQERRNSALGGAGSGTSAVRWPPALPFWLAARPLARARFRSRWGVLAIVIGVGKSFGKGKGFGPVPGVRGQGSGVIPRTQTPVWVRGWLTIPD